MFKLKDVLAKEVSTLSTEEKAFVAENWDLLNNDLRAKFAECEPKGTESISEKELSDLISKASRENIDATVDEISKALLGKFKSNLETMRGTVLNVDDQKKAEIKANNEITRNFLRAVKSGDAKTAQKLGQKALDTTDDGSGADAGYLIPEPLANEVLRIIPTGYGKAKQLFGYNLLTEGNSKRITALGSTLSVYWTDEGAKKTSSQPTFDIVTLTLKKLAVIVPMTEEVMEDSGVDLTKLVAQLIVEAVAKEEDLQFFMGDGTVWTGIFKDTNIDKVELASGKTAADLRPENILALADAIQDSPNNKYIMSRTMLSKVRTLRQNADGTGDYIYDPLGGGDYGTLNGRPLEIVEAAPSYTSATTTGRKPIMMYGDFKAGVAYGEKSDVRIKLLDQATITDTDGETVINLAEQDMVGIRAVKRVGMKVTLPTAMVRLVTANS